MEGIEFSHIRKMWVALGGFREICSCHFMGYAQKAYNIRIKGNRCNRIWRDRRKILPLFE